jgi:hypothetical protein
MAGKFIPLKQAAQMLGMTADKLNAMRLRGEVHALRDGTSWKFKKEELERVAEEHAITLAEDDEGLMEVGELGPTGASELVLDLDAEEAGEAPTTVGGSRDAGGARQPAEDSQLSLNPDHGGSDVDLQGGSSDVMGGTDLGLQGGSGELEFEGSGLGLASDLSLSDDDKGAGASSDDEEDLTIGDNGAVTLGEDAESALEGGSDVTRGTGDTGINLRPSDSGLNLEEVPLDLAGSSVSSLELPEDDDIIALEELEASPDEATQLRADEDFQLAPSVDLQQDEEDSGSQVIALEDSEAFAEAGAAGGLEDVGALLPGSGGTEDIDMQQEAKPITTPREFLAPPPEMPYSIWNVLALLLIAVTLSLTGMLMTDVLRNMWSWDGTYSASTPIMDSMIRLLGLDP